ncbi:type II secretion system F family protein [Kitasatospora aureofaciens]|uniref:type II secretion system F family protein n=1 Tax=Kitasatospora aureofaciens TaxID=1894 RepID=UPI001C4499FA|nr:type II secretion system F family protein [Kitasatospora aureofaciens]MBV6696958.1 type II secretion system F family protein [Kitasatospora aureofaciens]
MTDRQASLWWAMALCVMAIAGWRALQQQVPGGRRSRLVLAGAGPPVPPMGPAVSGSSAIVRRPPRWLVPELLLLPTGLAAGHAVASPVPVLAAVLAFLPLRRWRERRRVAAEAGRRAAGVVELCTGLAGELRSGSTPEQALHLVTTRIAADPEALRRLGEEPVARLAAGRYGGDVPAALHLLAELPGGSGAAAIAACWRVASDGGAGLAAALDRVAEALRAERALAEEIAGELAGPRTTIAVLAALPAAGLLLGAALGARPVNVLLHTPAGLGCLAAGAALEGLGVAWTARIVRAAAQGALEAPWRPAGRSGGGGLRARVVRMAARGDVEAPRRSAGRGAVPRRGMWRGWPGVWRPVSARPGGGDAVQSRRAWASRPLSARPSGRPGGGSSTGGPGGVLWREVVSG